MAGKMKLDVVTPDGYVLHGVETDSVNVPTTAGSIGILWNHAPMAATLKAGLVRYSAEDGEQRVRITGGYMEVDNNTVIVLADAAEPVAGTQPGPSGD